jgi:hypothetical protein
MYLWELWSSKFWARIMKACQIHHIQSIPLKTPPKLEWKLLLIYTAFLQRNPQSFLSVVIKNFPHLISACTSAVACSLLIMDEW